MSIEVHIAQGIRFFIVGLAESAIRESQQRIESALMNNGFQWPRYRVVINLAPADIRKDGTHFDLPLALGILAASGQIGEDSLEGFMAMGELSLDGGIHTVKGVLPMTLMARKFGYRGVIIPAGNAAEASVVENIRVIPVESLKEVVEFLDSGILPEGRRILLTREVKPGEASVDYSDVKGQEAVKRAMLIAAAGRHNLLLIGPPGSGKSMMARRVTTILPSMSLEESIETTTIYSVAGKTEARAGLITSRPFRTPHHSSSNMAMIGGGSTPHPGEISMAHNGVLFLDELPEFRRHVLEVLRQPLEDRLIHISRAGYKVVYPADFMLIAAMNPCPCGYYNHPTKECNCGPGRIRHYLSRISGPLLDRIDMHVETAPVPFEELTGTHSSRSSNDLRDLVELAQVMQKKRFPGTSGILVNSRMEPGHRRKFCQLDKESRERMQSANEKLGLSARAYDRILNVSRTIADLDESERILPAHITEALSFRNLDRDSWAG